MLFFAHRINWGRGPNNIFMFALGWNPIGAICPPPRSSAVTHFRLKVAPASVLINGEQRKAVWGAVPRSCDPWPPRSLSRFHGQLSLLTRPGQGVNYIRHMWRPKEQHLIEPQDAPRIWYEFSSQDTSVSLLVLVCQQSSLVCVCVCVWPGLLAKLWV